MGGLSGLAREFARNPVKTGGFILKRLAEIPARGLPSLPKYVVDDFDKAHGIDTSTLVQVIVTDSPNAKWGTKYETSPEPILRWLIDNCELPIEKTTFIDFGSGKGRPMIVAASYPFKAVQGVEYSPDLVETCRKNLIVLGLQERVELTYGDATEFPIPGGPVLALFNNPFFGEVQQKVLANLKAAKGPVTIAHRGPGHEGVLEAGGVEFKRTDHGARLYRFR